VIRTIYLKIFNRWGEKVFETTNQFEGWDGTYKGVMQNPSVYTYNVDVTFLDNKKVERKGTVSIIR
jgi:gliding motility-associated-like protein